MKNWRGFTLIELLVVVSIIAVLSAIGIVVFSTSQKDARDGKRRADLDAFSKALETNLSQSDSTYSLSPAMFTAAKVPVESQTGRPAYCFYYSTSRTDARGDNPESWVTTSSCPALTGTVTVAVSLGSNTSAVGMAWWKVCAVLERGNEVICKNSTQ